MHSRGLAECIMSVQQDASIHEVSTEFNNRTLDRAGLVKSLLINLSLTLAAR